MAEGAPCSTVRHLLISKHGQFHCDSDLIFVEGVPFIVIEWSEMAGQEIPLVTVELDPARLVKLGWPTAEYLYQGGPIEDPRTDPPKPPPMRE